MCSIFAISADHEYILTVKKMPKYSSMQRSLEPHLCSNELGMHFLQTYLKKVNMVREHLFKVVELNKGYEKCSNVAQAILKLSRCLLWKN